MNEWMTEWMNDAFIQRFIVYCCTLVALYNHMGGGVSSQPPPVCSIHLDDIIDNKKCYAYQHIRMISEG